MNQPVSTLQRELVQIQERERKIATALFIVSDDLARVVVLHSRGQHADLQAYLDRLQMHYMPASESVVGVH